MEKFLVEGDVIELSEKHKVYAEVPRHFVYANKKGDFSLTTHDVQLTGDFEHLQGEYTVIKTETSGGGTAHGPYDIYPDGYKVTCEKSDGTIVSFYQSGSFTAMIKDIVPIGKAPIKRGIEE